MWSADRWPGSSTIDPARFASRPGRTSCGVREEFAPWIDASIWIQGDLDEQERRLVARDGDSAAQQDHIAGWLAEELPLMLREQPWQKATIVVAGTTELDHDPYAEIVVASPAAP